MNIENRLIPASEPRPYLAVVYDQLPRQIHAVRQSVGNKITGTTTDKVAVCGFSYREGELAPASRWQEINPGVQCPECASILAPLPEARSKAPAHRAAAAGEGGEALLLTISKAAKLLGFSTGTMYELLYKGEFQSIEIPSGKGTRKIRRIPRAELSAFIARNLVKSGTTPGAFPLD